MGLIQRFLLGNRVEDDLQVGLFLKNDGTVWLRNPDGSETQISGSPGGNVDGDIVTVQLRRADAATWTSDNPVLASGEFGIELDTGKFKWGDGSTAWNDLAYIGPSVTADRDPDDVIDGSYPVGQTWFNSNTNVEWRLTAGELGNTWVKDISLGGGGLFSEGGEINSGGGTLASDGGTLASGGGDIESTGGNVELQGGNVDGGGGNIVTSGGWLGVSDEFAVGLVGMWAGAADPTVDPGVGGFNRGTIWQQAADSGKLWMKTADDVSQISRVTIANATGGTFTLVIDSTESNPVDFDYFGGDQGLLRDALDIVLPIVAETGKSRAALGLQIDQDNGDLLITFLQIWSGQPITCVAGANDLTGPGVTINVGNDQEGTGSTSWVGLATTDDLP